MEIKTEGIELPNGDFHVFIPPLPTETERGGITAKTRTNETIEAAIDPETGRMYVPESSGSVQVDETLTKSGQAADAAVVGRKIKNIKGTLSYINVVKELDIDNTGDIDVTTKINDAIQNVGHNKVLYFPAGKYKISDTILLDKDVSILGDTFLTRQEDIDFGGIKYTSGTVFVAYGEKFLNKSIIEASGWVPDFIAHITIISDSCKITDPRLAAGEDNMSTDGNVVDSFTKEIRYENVVGIHSRGWGSRLEHIRIFGCSGIGFQLEMGDMVDNCMAQSCHIGYQIATDCTATDLRVNACDIGYFVKGTSNTITNMRADGCHEVGMKIEGGNSNISSCYFDFCNGALLHLYNSNSNTIKNIRGRSGAIYAGFRPENIPNDGIPFACGLLMEGNCFNNDIDINVGYDNLSDNNSLNTHNGPTFKIVCKDIDTDHRYQAMNNIHLSGTHFNKIWQNFGTPLPIDIFKQIFKLIGNVQVAGQLWYMGVEYGFDSLTADYNGQKIYTDNDYPYTTDIWSGWFKPVRKGMICHNTNSKIDFLYYADDPLTGDSKMLNLQQTEMYNDRITALENNNLIEVGEVTTNSYSSTVNSVSGDSIQMNFYGKTTLEKGKRYEIIIDSYSGVDANEYSLYIYNNSWNATYLGVFDSNKKKSLTPEFDIKNFTIQIKHNSQPSAPLDMNITIKKLKDQITLKEYLENYVITP